MNKKSPYILAADVIRVIAISGVVMIHTANSIFTRPDFFGGLSWWLALSLNSFSRIAVPLFIILSGYLILQKSESFRSTIKRTMTRIGIPLVVWFIIYTIWNGGNPSLENINAVSVLTGLFTVNVYHLYFLAIMMGLYLVSPFLRSYLTHASPHSQKNLAYVTVGLGAIITLLQYALLQCNSWNIVSFWLPYAGLFISGYVIKNMPEIKNKMTLGGIYLAGFITTTGLNYYHFYLLKNNLPVTCAAGYLDNAFNIGVLAMTFSAFIFLINCKFDWIKGKPQQLIHSVARASMGIYLIHLIFIHIFQNQIPLIGHYTPQWLFLFINWFVIIAISYIATLLIMRIPLLRKIIGEK